MMSEAALELQELRISTSLRDQNNDCCALDSHWWVRVWSLEGFDLGSGWDILTARDVT